MNEEIKEIIKGLQNISTPTGISYSGDITINNDDVKILEDYITNLQQKNERLEKNNNELRKIYKNTCKHLFDIEHDELARYFQAQIDECSTFQVETIDCYKECEDYQSRIVKALSWTNRVIEIIKQQPSEDDTWILENLHSIKYLLQGSDK